MSIEITLLQGAEADLLEAFILFDERAKGEDFYHAIDDAFEQLKAFPESGIEVASRYRRLLLNRFPYGIFYRLHAERLVVIAILDLRLNPESIFKRLK